MKNLNNNEELNTKVKKYGKKKLSSNPINGSSLPIEGIKMISVPLEDSAVQITKPDEVKTPKKKSNTVIKPISIADETSLSSIVETINNFNTSRTKPKKYNNEYTLNIPKTSTLCMLQIIKEHLTGHP